MNHDSIIRDQRGACVCAGVLNAPRSSGFTLIELMVVMVIAVAITAISLPSFISMGRGIGMRTAVNNVSATIALSRQWAITHREKVTFIISNTGLVYNITSNQVSLAANDHACYYATNAGGAMVQSITDLPLDVNFASGSETNLKFQTDGGLGGVGDVDILLKYKNIQGAPNKTISVNKMTGAIKVE